MIWNYLFFQRLFEIICGLFVEKCSVFSLRLFEIIWNRGLFALFEIILDHCEIAMQVIRGLFVLNYLWSFWNMDNLRLFVLGLFVDYSKQGLFEIICLWIICGLFETWIVWNYLSLGFLRLFVLDYLGFFQDHLWLFETRIIWIIWEYLSLDYLWIIWHGDFWSLFVFGLFEIYLKNGLYVNICRWFVDDLLRIICRKLWVVWNRDHWDYLSLGYLGLFVVRLFRLFQFICRLFGVLRLFG